MVRAGLPGSGHCVCVRLLDLRGEQNARQGKTISLIPASRCGLFFAHFNRVNGLRMVVFGGRSAHRRGGLGGGRHTPTPRRKMRLGCS
jgi:hypothetical protein